MLTDTLLIGVKRKTLFFVGFLFFNLFVSLK
nr:MAG TPA: hypothetical protein [Microviridae sp.]